MALNKDKKYYDDKVQLLDDEALDGVSGGVYARGTAPVPSVGGGAGLQTGMTAAVQQTGALQQASAVRSVAQEGVAAKALESNGAKGII